MIKHWILVGQLPVLCSDVLEWAAWFENAENRRVDHTQVADNVEVSTVFLGLDHRFLEDGSPLLFETMVFRDGEGVEMWRCSTWLEAETQHQKAVMQCRSEVK